MDTIAKRLAAARMELGLSQADLARLAKVSAGAIGNIESGTRQGTARVIQCIAGALGVNTEWLVDGAGPKRAAPPWPFHQIDRDQIESLTSSQLAAVEGAILLTLAQLGSSRKDRAA